MLDLHDTEILLTALQKTDIAEAVLKDIYLQVLTSSAGSTLPET